MTTSGPPIAQRQLGDDLPVDLRLTPEPGGALAGLPDVGSPTLSNGARSNHDDQPRACPISCSARSMAFGTTTSMIPVVCMTAAEAVMFHAYSANATGGSPPAPSKVGTEPFGGEHLAQRVVVTGGLLLAGVPIRVGHARVLLKNLLRRPRNDHWPWPHRRGFAFRADSTGGIRRRPAWCRRRRARGRSLRSRALLRCGQRNRASISRW